MTVRAVESCDLCTTAQFQAGTARWLSIANVTTGLNVIAGRNGNAFRCNSGGSGNAARIRRTIDDQATWFVGFGFRWSYSIYTGIPAIFAVSDNGTDQVTAYILSDGRVRLNRGATVLATSAFGLPQSVWYHMEFKVVLHGTTGIFECRLNGDVIVTFSGNTLSTANAFAAQIHIGSHIATSNSSAFYALDYDDLYMADGGGAQNYLGDCRVQALSPTGAGATTGFTPSAGSNWDAVNDAANPNDDTDYVAASAVSTDTYAMADLSGSIGQVFAVNRVFRSRNDDAGISSIAPVLRVGSTDYLGTARNQGSTYLQYDEIAVVNPANGLAWTAADVAAMEYGIKRTA